MNKTNKAFAFASSVLLLFSVFVVSGGVQPHPVEGGPVESYLTLDATNPAAISVGVPNNGSIFYKNSVWIQYENVQDTVGYHTTIKESGRLYNDASTAITSITSITATFSGSGSLKAGLNYHRETVTMDITLESGTPVNVTDYSYFEIFASGGDIALSSLILTYSCTLQEPVMYYTLHGTYYDFAYVTRDPYVVDVPSTYNELPVTGLQANAFVSDPSLTTVTLNTGLTSIGNSAFYYCEKLTSVTLPSTLTYIGQNAFDHTTSLTSISLPSGLLTIDYYGFKNSKLESIILPDGLTTVGDSSFIYCDALAYVVIPTSLTSVDPWAFYGCSAIANVFYRGNATEWAAITFGSGNSPVQYGPVSYFSETDPSAPGYWHYVAGVPTVWPV